ncbi:hypothetical protein [Nocardia sp. NPDC051570]|uniref:hypothetical protein n=1 Tax=Nocardia sp. NPDC051570 TaxID=3364324 RepID=UPI0037B937CC
MSASLSSARPQPTPAPEVGRISNWVTARSPLGVFVSHEPEPETVIAEPLLPHTWHQALTEMLVICLVIGFFWLCWGGA